MNQSQEELAKLAGTDFFQLAKTEPYPRTRVRLLALGHLQAGKTKSEVILLQKEWKDSGKSKEKVVKENYLQNKKRNLEKW